MRSLLGQLKNLLRRTLRFHRKKLLLRIRRVIGGKRLAVLLLIILILFGRFITTRPTEWKLETSEVSRGELVESISSSGEVKAQEIANLTFQTSGRLAWVGVKEGDFVNKYQAIAKLDTLALSVAYQQALNTYKSLDAAAKKVEDDVKGHAGDETFEQKATRTAAQVARDNAYDSVQSAQQALKFATIITPISGLVVEANPEIPGINVSPPTATYVIVNPDSVYFAADANEVDVSQIYVGQKASVRFDAYPDERFEGKIRKIGFQSVTTTTGATAYRVEVDLIQGQDLKFRVGMNGDAEFLLQEKKDILLVPATSIVEVGEEIFVWIVNEDGKAERIEVKTGASSIDSIEIVSGLDSGNTIVKRPPSEIKAGDKIKASN